MPFDPTGIGTAAVGAGMGLLLQNTMDRRQLRQEEKLQKLNIQGQQQMTNFNVGKQLQMWKDTSYGAQKEQMQKAGLNPGLMYGMSGGGGQTAGISAGQVPSGGAPKGGGEVMGMMSQAMAAQQLSLLKAQKENIDADTANKQSTTGKTDTETEYNKSTMHWRELLAEWTASEKGQNVHRDQMLNDILEGTKGDQIDTIKLGNALTRAQIGKTSQESQKIANEIGMMAQKLLNETNEVAIKQQLADFETKWGNDAGSILKQLIGKIIKPR